MNRSLQALLYAQFLSAFADNAILFTVIAMVLQNDTLPGWYVPALQSTFVIAYVLLAPWAAQFADLKPKTRVLMAGNVIKALGALMILLDIQPLLSYAIVGLGAALYSPAKYGILPEMSDERQLVKANSWMEGATIAAILLGTVVGAWLADYSLDLALGIIIGLYLVSFAVTFLIRNQGILRTPENHAAVKLFFRQMRQFLATGAGHSHFVLIGSCLFWATAATLRVILVAWAPPVLHTASASDIANLTLFLAIGIIAGSALVPQLIPIEKFRRSRHVGILMGAFILGLAFTDTAWMAKTVMFGIGFFGGLFIVPINAVLQQLGHQEIGGGRAVAIQNFFANSTMLIALGSYTFAASQGLSPTMALWILAGFLICGCLLIHVLQRVASSAFMAPATQESPHQ